MIVKVTIRPKGQVLYRSNARAEGKGSQNPAFFLNVINLNLNLNLNLDIDLIFWQNDRYQDSKIRVITAKYQTLKITVKMQMSQYDQNSGAYVSTKESIVERSHLYRFFWLGNCF